MASIEKTSPPQPAMQPPPLEVSPVTFNTTIFDHQNGALGKSSGSRERQALTLNIDPKDQDDDSSSIETSSIRHDPFSSTAPTTPPIYSPPVVNQSPYFFPSQTPGSTASTTTTLHPQSRTLSIQSLISVSTNATIESSVEDEDDERKANGAMDDGAESVGGVSIEDPDVRMAAEALGDLRAGQYINLSNYEFSSSFPHRSCLSILLQKKNPFLSRAFEFKFIFIFSPPDFLMGLSTRGKRQRFYLIHEVFSKKERKNETALLDWLNCRICRNLIVVVVFLHLCRAAFVVHVRYNLLWSFVFLLSHASHMLTAGNGYISWPTDFIQSPPSAPMSPPNGMAPSSPTTSLSSAAALAASQGTAAETEPLMNLIGVAHPYIGQAVAAGRNVYRGGKSYSPRFRYGAEMVSPIAFIHLSYYSFYISVSCLFSIGAILQLSSLLGGKKYNIFFPDPFNLIYFIPVNYTFL